MYTDIGLLYDFNPDKMINFNMKSLKTYVLPSIGQEEQQINRRLFFQSVNFPSMQLLTDLAITLLLEFGVLHCTFVAFSIMKNDPINGDSCLHVDLFMLRH